MLNSVTSDIFSRVSEIRGNKQGQGTMKIKKIVKIILKHVEGSQKG